MLQIPLLKVIQFLPRLLTALDVDEKVPVVLRLMHASTRDARLQRFQRDQQLHRGTFRADWLLTFSVKIRVDSDNTSHDVLSRESEVSYVNCPKDTEKSWHLRTNNSSSLR